ncbi:MAG TPA: YSC84-related protein [Terriglobales bacterium]|nr:YSC84-related protein [Terriglobales bacterium]
MKSLTKLITLWIVLAVMAAAAYAQNRNSTTQESNTAKDSSANSNQSDEVKRVQAAARVLDEIMATPDKGIPQEVFKSAECIAVVPSMIKGGFIVGGRYGKGVATCRTTNGWSAPAPISIAGGSWGLQFGGEAVDLVMLVMNQQGMDHLLSSKFKLGAEGSVAAGPIGRQAEGSTDWKMKSEVLTYSRARGVFAGIELNGAVIKQDNDETRVLYGKMVPFRAILSGKVPPPPGTEAFVATVRKYAAEASAERGSLLAPAPNPERPLTPSEAKRPIEEKLRTQPGLYSKDIHVTLRAGAVELYGSVPSLRDRLLADRIAESYAGNRQVQDHLNVQL